jgi:hypothetical protein
MSPYVAPKARGLPGRSEAATGLTLAAMCGVCLVCCGTSVTGDDTSLDSTSDALTCGPNDVSTYVPGTMNPPIGLHQNACSVQETIDYAQCNSQVDPTKCSEFTSGQTGAMCAACIESQASAPTWGVIVFNGTTGEVNIGGCVDDALGQVASEPSSCGQLLFASYGCQNAACGGCTGDQFDACDTLALAGAVSPILASTCKSYDNLVESSASPCAALTTADVLPTAVSNCFPDASLAGNPMQQDADWLTRIACFMCGPPMQDQEGQSCP